MPQLVLGPLLRYVGSTTATVWVETDAPCTVEVLGHEPDAGVRSGGPEGRSPTFHVEGHHYGLVLLEDLEPGTERAYEVHLDGERVWPQPGDPRPPSVIRPRLLTAIRMLGDICIPLLLFTLGVRLADASFHAWGIGLAGAVARPALGMLIAWGAGWALGLSAQHQALLLVFGALPPAVLNYVFAERYRQEPDKVASIVMVGNVAALAFIPLALAIVLD